MKTNIDNKTVAVRERCGVEGCLDWKGKDSEYCNDHTYAHYYGHSVKIFQGSGRAPKYSLGTYE
jgi:hypothetical protein